MRHIVLLSVHTITMPIVVGMSNQPESSWLDWAQGGISTWCVRQAPAGSQLLDGCSDVLLTH